MTTDTERALSFFHVLHNRLAVALGDTNQVKTRVDALFKTNSFRESCFCKGCVLPVVDSVTSQFLGEQFRATHYDVHQALRCEGFATPMYECDRTQSGFSSHSRSNSYHPGDKSGRRSTSRRSPDFCVRYAPGLRILGEMKYVPSSSKGQLTQLLHECRDYLSIHNEPTSDWGHDFAFGLLYEYGAEKIVSHTVTDYWLSDRIFLSLFMRAT